MDTVSNAKLSALVKQYESASLEDFLAAFQSPFLVLERKKGDRDTAQFHTLHGAQGPSLEDAAKTDPGRPVRLEAGEKIVCSIVKSPRNTFRNKVTVGRSVNNDIIIGNPAISKFHAFFEQNRELGAFTLMDVGSSNGTSVAGKALQPNVRVQLQSGEEIVFGGAVTSAFYEVADFHAYLDIVRRSGIV